MWPALALASLLAAGAAALVLLAPAGADAPSPAAGRPEVAAAVRLSPRTLQFGDTLTARVEVLVDGAVVDPGSVRVRQEFSPWRQIAPTRTTRREAGRTSLVVTTYVLRCIISPCVPPRETAPLEFDPARITYRRRDGQAAQPVEARWPVLVVHSNIVASELERPGAASSPWQADLVSFRPPSYSVSPNTLRWLLAGAGALLVLGGALLAYLAVPRRAPAPEPEPEPEPEPSLTPLERALRLLSAESPSNGAADQRRALELVAEELEAEPEGDLDLARRARRLAWSEEAPTLEQTGALAADVREWLAVHAPPEPETGEGEAADREEAGAPARQ